MQNVFRKFTNNRAAVRAVLSLSMGILAGGGALVLAYSIAIKLASIPMGPDNAVATVADLKFASAASALWTICLLSCFVGMAVFAISIGQFVMQVAKRKA